MSHFIIKGGYPLKGEVGIKGAKNAVLKAIAASLLSKEAITIKNVSWIEDVERMIEILIDLGGKVEIDKTKNQLLISTKIINKTKLSLPLSQSLRTSIMFVGPLLARFGEAELAHPGGCAIGRRPIDIFIEGFKALGVEVKQKEDTYHFTVKKLKGAKFIFPKISVTATEAMMMTAVLAEGTTTLINAALEPEISALARYFNSCGAKIKGAGTSTIFIEGVKQIKAKEMILIPDRIEAGSFAIMAAVSHSLITITKCHPSHLEVPLLLLGKAGVKLKIGKDYIKVFPSFNFKATDIVTHEYPGFITDLQAPMTVFLTQAQGMSLVHETIFEGRLFYIDYLNRMNAQIIMCDPYRILINGPTTLIGKSVESPDLRAGLALVIAGLIAQNKTVIDNIYQIDRGYENLDQRLRALGAKIERV